MLEMVLSRTPRDTALNIARRCCVQPASKIEWWELRFGEPGGEPRLVKRCACVDKGGDVWLEDENGSGVTLVGSLHGRAKRKGRGGE